MIEISEDKVCELYENIEKGLKYMGKAMRFAEDIKSDSERHGYREEEDDDEEERFGERGGMRRGVRGRGRYGKY